MGPGNDRGAGAEGSAGGGVVWHPLVASAATMSVTEDESARKRM